VAAKNSRNSLRPERAPQQVEENDMHSTNLRCIPSLVYSRAATGKKIPPFG